MAEIDEYLENPTISKITRQEKNKYKMSHINILDLLKRIELLEKENKRVDFLEQQEKKYKESESVLKQEIAANKNEINKLKATCSELEKRIQKYESNKQSTNEVVAQKTTIPVNEQKNAVKIGEIIKFGKYEGKDIEWQVLDRNQKDNSVLLISKYLLFKKAYNDKREDCTWDFSTTRRYLNNDFYRNAFNVEEKKQIKEEMVENSDNTRWKTQGGGDTKDKVFLLSIDEAKRYFKTNEKRKATLIGEESSWYYWLRSPGITTNYAAYVNDAGSVSGSGSSVDGGDIGIRPALWINL